MYKIIELTEKHIDSLVFLEQACFEHPWTKGMFIGDLKSEQTVYYGAVCGDALIGYAGMWIALDEGQITNVAVHPEHRRQGIAMTLIDKLICFCLQSKLKEITLEVRQTNEKAIKLYEKMGFGEVGIRKNYYKNPVENAVLMTKYLNTEGLGK